MDPAQVEEASPCGLCGEPLIEGADGSREPRGRYHVGCIREERQKTLGGWDSEALGYGPARRQRRRS